MYAYAVLRLISGHDERVLAILAPGQGAQRPGLLTPWLDSPTTAAYCAQLSAWAGTDVVAYGTTGDADQIRDTAIAQPLLVTSALASFQALKLDLPADKVLYAGHSVGEIAAAAMAGVMSDEQAMRFVSVRATGMAEASPIGTTSMAAVIGGKPDDVLAAIERCGLTAANYNGKGQIVAAGTMAQLDALRADPPARARVIALDVAAAFHTIHMAPAVERLEALAQTMQVNDPVSLLLTNRDGQVVTDGHTYLNRLVNQVSHPVRWDLCMQTMVEVGVTGILELAPGGVLTGIAKRNMPVELFALTEPDQLPAAREFALAHTQEVAQ